MLGNDGGKKSLVLFIKEKGQAELYFYEEHLEYSTVWLYCFSDIDICDLISWNVTEEKLFASSAFKSMAWSVDKDVFHYLKQMRFSHQKKKEKKNSTASQIGKVKCATGMTFLQ